MGKCIQICISYGDQRQKCAFAPKLCMSKVDFVAKHCQIHRHSRTKGVEFDHFQQIRGGSLCRGV